MENIPVKEQTLSLLMYFLEQSEGLFEDVLKEVLEEGETGNIEEALKFYQGLDNLVKTSEGSQNLKGLVKELPPKLKEASFEEPDPLFSLCLGWSKLKDRENPEVAELVGEHPELTNFFITDLNEDETEKIKKLCDQIGNEVSEVCLEESQLGPEHISLLAFIKLAEGNLKGYSETKEETLEENEDTKNETPADEEESDSPISNKWKELLAEIEGWPTSEDVWDEIEGFLEGVKMIAEEKKKIKQLLEKIENQIHALTSDNWAMVEFFGFSAISEWAVENLDEEKANEALDGLHELKEYFSSYSVLHQKSPENIVERRTLRQNMGELENKIGATFKKIENILLNYEEDKKEVGEIGFKIDEETPEEKWDYKPKKVNPIRKKAEKYNKKRTDSESETFSEKQTDKEKSLNTDNGEVISEKGAEYSQGDNLTENEVADQQKAPELEMPGATEKNEDEDFVSGKKKDGILDTGARYSSSEEMNEDTSREEESSRVALAVEIDEAESEALSFGEKKLWEMISKRDIPGAYWVSRSLENSGEDPISPDMLKALQASWWLPSGQFKVEKELGDLAKKIKTGKGESTRIVGLATALLPSILAPRVGLQNWLFTPEDCPELSKLVENIGEFAEKEISLKVEDMENRPVQVARKERIEQLSRGIENLISGNMVPEYISDQGQVVLKNLLKEEEGELYRLLDIVSKGKKRNLEKVEGMLEDWQGEEKIKQKIGKVHSGLSSLTKRVLSDPEYREMVRFIMNLLEKVEQWCSEVHSYNRIVSGENRYDEMVQILQSVTSISGPEAIKEIREIRSKNEDNPRFEGALNCVLWSLGVLMEIFKINHDVEFPNSEIKNHWWLEEARNLDEALSRRFYWTPDITTDEDGFPIEEPGGNSIIDPVYQANPSLKNLAEAGEKWLDVEDYRFIEKIIEAIESLDEEEVIRTRFEVEKEKLRQILGKKISQTEETIESALSNGFINAEQKKRFIKGINSIETEKVLNFNGAFKRLDQVRQELDKVLEEQTDELQAKEAAWAWLQLRFRRQKGESETRKYMETLFQFLGFLKIPEENSFQVLSSQKEFLHIRQRMSSSDPGRLFPQFASRTENEYDTVCFWEEPGADTLGDFIQKARLDTQALIVIYFGRLSSDQKKELMEGSRGNVQVAVLDESLILEELGKEDNALAELTLEYLALKKKNPGKKIG